MRSAARQLALDLPVGQSFEAEDFLPGAANRAALEAVLAWPAWPQPNALLVGPPGTGKSHLASIWAERAGAVRLPAMALREPILPGLAEAGAVAVEDADRDTPEPALFHLLNLAREAGVSLLLTARTVPDAWGLATPDLLSRLRLIPVQRIEAPDEVMLRAVLVKLFVDRQVTVEAGVIDTLVRHLDRSLGTARTVVERLDRAALEQGRRITRPLVLSVLSVGEGDA